MQLDRKALRPCDGKYGARLIRRESDPLAKGVDCISKSRGSDVWNDQIDDLLNIGGPVIAIFRRQGVCGEQGRSNPHRSKSAQSPGCAQHLGLVRQIESVAGLDLHRRHAVRQKGVQSRQGLRHQFIFAGGAGRLDAGHDPAPLARDLFVRGAGET